MKYEYIQIFLAILQFLRLYVGSDSNSIILFLERLLKLVFSLFVLALCNNAFVMSVVSNDRNRRMIFLRLISVKIIIYFLYCLVNGEIYNRIFRDCQVYID